MLENGVVLALISFLSAVPQHEALCRGGRGRAEPQEAGRCALPPVGPVFAFLYLSVESATEEPEANAESATAEAEVFFSVRAKC